MGITNFTCLDAIFFLMQAATSTVDECCDVNGCEIRSWARHSVEGFGINAHVLRATCRVSVTIRNIGQITCDLVICVTIKSACAECNNNGSAR